MIGPYKVAFLAIVQLCSISFAYSDALMDATAALSPHELLNASSQTILLHSTSDQVGRQLLARRSSTRGRKSRASRNRKSSAKQRHSFSNKKRASTKTIYAGADLAQKKEEMQKKEESLRLAREAKVKANEARNKNLPNNVVRPGGDIKFSAADMGMAIDDDDTLPFRVTDFPSGSTLQFFAKGTLCMYEEFDIALNETAGQTEERGVFFTMRGAWFVPTGGKVSVLVISPTKSLLFRSSAMANEGYWEETVIAEGSYRICITSGTNQKVLLAMDIASNEDRSETELGMAPGRSLEDVLEEDEDSGKSELVEAVERLSDVLRDVESEQNNLKFRLQRNSYTAMSNENRVFYAGLMEGTVVVAMGIFQVLFMKQLFARKISNFDADRKISV